MTVLRAVRRPFDTVDPARWDALAAANPWATPFCHWAFHRAWWDGYGGNAHEETVVFVPADAPGRRRARGHRPADAPPRGGAGRRRAADDDPPHGRPDPDAGLAGREGGLLRRLVPRRLRHAPRRARGPARGRGRARGVLRRRWAIPATRCRGTPWTSAGCARATRRPTRSRRPSVPGRWRRAGRSTWSPRRSARSRRCRRAGRSTTTSATLGKKERHEIRRKVRRAEAVGEVRLDDSTDPLADLPGVHRPAPEALGRRRPVPGHRGRRAQPHLLPPAVRAVPGRRAAEPGAS